MIRLTRIGNAEQFWLNADLIERIEQHAHTTVRLANGSEYVVAESAESIVSLIRSERAAVLALSYVPPVERTGEVERPDTPHGEAPPCPR